MTRRDRERLRLAIAHALLNATRPLALANSPLLEESTVAQLARDRYPESVLGAELALGDLVREAGCQVLARLGGDPRLGRERAVLETVLAGGSVRAAAQALGRSREHVSNTAWRNVTAWALEAFEGRCADARRAARAGGRGGSRLGLLS